VVGEAEDGRATLEKAGALFPDVVVLDIKLSDMSGIEVCGRLKKTYPLVKVIMLSMYEDYEYVNRALQGGADGYLLKKVASAELVSAIRKAHRGEKVFSPQVLDMIVSSFKEDARGEPGPASLDRLTAREYEVLRLMSDGLSNKEIGARLFVSPKTVEKTVSVIFRKLEVSSRTAAVKAFLSGAGPRSGSRAPDET
jgi:DNA-binding NarL/FixJ family response regulator